MVKKSLKMSPEEERWAIRIVVNEFDDAGDDAMDDDGVVDEKMVDVSTQKIERSWRKGKGDLVNQHVSVLRRNIGVEMFRFNHLFVNIPFNERRK